MVRILRSIIQLLISTKNLRSMSNLLIARYRAYNNSSIQLHQNNHKNPLSTLKSPCKNPIAQRLPSNGNSYLFKYPKNSSNTSSNVLKQRNQQPISRQCLPSHSKISFGYKQKVSENKRDFENTESFLNYKDINKETSKSRLFGGNDQKQNKTTLFLHRTTTPNNGNLTNTKQNIRNQQGQPPRRYEDVKTSLGLVGLDNIGNTCYMNSILQCLFNLPAFNDYFLRNQYFKELSFQGRVAETYAKLIARVRNSSKKSQNAAQIKIAISSKKLRFSGYSQQDAHQFLATLLQQISLDLNRAKNPKYKELSADLSKQTLQQISEQWWNYNQSRENSIITDFFAGQLLSRVVCCRCRNESIAFDNSWDYPLSFSSNNQNDLTTMLQNFLKEETLNNDYYCSKCKDFRECKKKVDFYRLPKILVLQLKRFSYGKYNKQKINTKVKIPTQLNLSKMIYKSSNSTRDGVFQLVGMVHHIGDIDFGHYTAECCNPVNGKWYLFNDSSVSSSVVDKYLESSSPYLLFYSRV